MYYNYYACMISRPNFFNYFENFPIYAQLKYAHWPRTIIAHQLKKPSTHMQMGVDNHKGA